MHFTVNAHVFKQQILRHFELALIALNNPLDTKIISVVRQLLKRHVHPTTLRADDGAVRASLRLVVFQVHGSQLLVAPERTRHHAMAAFACFVRVSM